MLTFCFFFNMQNYKKYYNRLNYFLNNLDVNFKLTIYQLILENFNLLYKKKIVVKKE